MGSHTDISTADWSAPAADRHPAEPLELERVLLEVRSGVVPSDKPPVRIYLGTETAQRRAERVFVWSIEQVRDPARVYEIYLMKDLPGFDRSRWLTGFTNYRFAIPDLAGRQGRAIYNDVDQIYLSDPAELFDAPMNGKGFLSISDRDTSVMLIDCGRMAALWNLDQARRLRRKRLEAKAREAGPLWGACDPGWNARDEEYTPEGAKLVHYTVIHSQPWRPVPERYVYQRNPVAYLWEELERSADRAGFLPFTAERPSRRFRHLGVRYRQHRLAGEAGGRDRGESRATPDTAILASAEQLVRDAQAGCLLHARLSAAAGPGFGLGGLDLQAFDPLRAPGVDLPPGTFDGVVCSSLLEYLPDEDLPWVVDALFARARRFLFAWVADSPPSLVLGEGGELPSRRRSPHWWRTLFEQSGARHPAVHWRLALSQRGGWRFTGGGRTLDAVPLVWVLADDKPGHRIQSEGLARALDWPFEVKTLQFNALNRLSHHLLGASLAAVDPSRSDPLAAPWPDLVISTGRRTAPVARWVAARSLGKTRVVQLGRKGGEIADDFDLVVSCLHFRQPYHPRRLETLAPLNPLIDARLSAAAERWQGLFDATPAPHVALVVGGSSAMHRLDAATARRMAEEVRAFAEAAGGRVFTVTSPRTSPAAVAALREGLGDSAALYVWRPGDRANNPYLGYLALADILVVTGESESMLGEAAATGKPLYIYPLPERPAGVRTRLAEWIVGQARRARLNKRGTIRPQRGWQRLCARLVERGWVRPRRRLGLMHQALVRQVGARYFGEPLAAGGRSALRETQAVAQRVRALMGFET